MSQSWHLAIESSGLGGSIALLQYDENYQGELHTQVVLPSDKGSVQTLAPAIENIVKGAGLQPRHLGSLSVTAGPGSFTGLRVGLATAKMLSWTLNLPVVAVDTLETLAHRFIESLKWDRLPGKEPNSNSNTTSPSQSEYRLVAAINAFRRQVFTSSWLVMGDEVKCHLPSTVVDADKWLADPWQADNQRGPIVITGGALATYPNISADIYQLADPQLWSPQASQVGVLGLRGLAQGHAVTAEQLMPNYIRSSAAEENARAKKN